MHRARGLRLLATIQIIATLLSGICPSAMAIGTDLEGIGTIALISGKAFVRRGEISIPTPTDAASNPPNLKFSDQTARELGPNDPIRPTDVVITGDDSYLKIYYKDDSIMDVGPNTTFKVARFEQQANGTRHISFTLLSGKVRTLVTRSLDSDSSYRVATPTGSMGVHGTEWVTNAYQQNGLYRTDVTVLEGKVLVDLPKVGSTGLETVEHVAVTPGKTLSGMGNGGAVAKFSVFKLAPEQIQEITAMIPNIETKRMGSIAVTNPKATIPTAEKRESAFAQQQQALPQSPSVQPVQTITRTPSAESGGSSGAVDVSFTAAIPSREPSPATVSVTSEPTAAALDAPKVTAFNPSSVMPTPSRAGLSATAGSPTGSVFRSVAPSLNSGAPSVPAALAANRGPATTAPSSISTGIASTIRPANINIAPPASSASSAVTAVIRSAPTTRVVPMPQASGNAATSGQSAATALH